MSQINTITYYNALTVNGLNYNIKIKTPDAKAKGDSEKVKELFTTILCSHFGVDKVEDLGSRQITNLTMEYNSNDGAKIAGASSDTKIRDVFLKTFSENNDYKGMNVSGDEPTVSDTIEDLYNVLTSESISGSVDSSWSSAAGWGTWAVKGITSGIGSTLSGIGNVIVAAKNAISPSSGNRNSNDIEMIRKICDAVNADKDLDSEEMKYLKELAETFMTQIRSEHPNAKICAEDIKTIFLGMIDSINSQSEIDKIKVTNENKITEIIEQFVKN